MKFTVVSLAGAEQELASLWNDATDRSQITAPADQIDAVLARDPASFDESRGGNTRIALVAPHILLNDHASRNRDSL